MKAAGQQRAKEDEVGASCAASVSGLSGPTGIGMACTAHRHGIGTDSI